MNLKQLETLVCVAEAGTLSHAALLLETGQPVLSRQIRRLERELKIELFYRTGRGVRLTTAGKHVLAQAREILASMEKMRHDVAGLKRTQLTNLTIALSPTISRAITRPLTEKLLALYPNLSLRFVEGVSGHITEWLSTGRVDIAVTYYTNSISRMNFEEVCSEPLYLVAPKSSAPLPRTTNMAELGKIPLVLPGHPHGLRALLETMADAIGISLNVRLEADAFETIKVLVEAGFGHATLPLSSIRDEVEAGLFQISKVVSPELKRKLVLITSSGRIPSAGLNEVANMIKPLVKELSRK